MTALAQRHNAVNLGQGFPDFAPPTWLVEGARAALLEGWHQYAPAAGLPQLRNAIAEHQSRFWDLHYDPEHEITITNGATLAIYATIRALCDTGDEVILMEPFYDSYRASVAMAGAVDRCVPLRGADHTLDFDELEAWMSPRTRLLVLNTPHNPTGKVFSQDELRSIAELCLKHDIHVLCDEVYEHLVYDGQHQSLASQPGMRDRCIVVSSAGKTFSVTGWKVGHVCAPPALTQAIRRALQFMTFCVPPAFQIALANAYRAEQSYFDILREEYSTRRDLLVRGLQRAGFVTNTPAGSYFVCTDLRQHTALLDIGLQDDRDFCRFCTEYLGVAAIPCSAFYAGPQAQRHWVRWAFCKETAVIESGTARLLQLEDKLHQYRNALPV